MGLLDRVRSAAGARRRPSAASILRSEIDRERPELGQEYLAKTLESYASERLPLLRGELQDVRENAVRRGITGGDLGTSYEGDIMSAFQRNLANVGGRYASDFYESSRNRYLDLLAGTRDYETARANAKRKRGGFFGGLVGTLAGSFLGPLGAAAGAKVGSNIFK